jgi:hypothetical protein
MRDDALAHKMPKSPYTWLMLSPVFTMETESQPFLATIKDVSNHCAQHATRKAEKRSRKRTFSIVLFHILLIIAYTTVSIVVIRSDARKACPPLRGRVPFPYLSTPYSLTPVAIDNLKVEHDPEARNLYVSSRFAGSSHHLVDEAWQQLLANIDIRVTQQELQRNNRSSVSLPSGGYLAWLGVFHELHCVVGLSCGLYRGNAHDNAEVAAAVEV